ncbi:MAG: hypothetical protein WAU06_02240 [Candidatus Nanopelagicales bacterium]
MTMRAEHRRAAAGLLALASLLLVAGCGVPDPFASSGLGGKAITLDMPIVNGSHPFLIAHVRVAGGPSIPVLVDTGSPHCAGSDGLATFARQQGFAGILGIGLMKAPVYSPLVQLEGGPARSFGIRINPSQTSARLAFNVSPTAPTGAYPLPPSQDGPLPNGLPAWDSNSAAACWSFGTAAPACAPTSFDTGSPRVLASTRIPGAPGEGSAPGGTRLTMFTSSGANPVWSLSAGTTPGRDQMVVGKINAGNAVNTGLPLFTSRSVTFDIAGGQVLVSDPG